MRRAYPILTLITILIAFLSIRTFMNQLENGELDSNPNATRAIIAPPVLEPVPAKQPQMEKTARAPVDRRQSMRRDDASTEQLLREASERTLAQAKPKTEIPAKTEAPKKYSGSRYKFTTETSGPIETHCDTEECQNRYSGYTVAGIVVNAAPTRRSGERAMDGDMAIGDAKRVPLLHLK